MKKIFALFIIAFTVNMFAVDINVNKKPEPMQEKEFSFPKYSTKTLSNGIKVFVIEDHEQPTVYFRIMIEGGSSIEGTKTGVAEVTSEILSKGTKKRNALSIASTLDGVGASFGLSAGPDYISGFGGGLKKQINTVLDVVSDYIINPAFPNDEFEKIINQKIASIQYDKADPGSLAGALARKVVYGEKHPYSKKTTEESVNSISIDDVKKYYNLTFMPNNMTIAVIGDISEKEAVKLLEKYFGNWKKGEKPIINIPDPQSQPKGVYFINRAGSVQSSLIVTSLGIPYSYRDYESFDLAGSVIGAGFAGRLFRTLRETYSFTYTPFGYVSGSKYANRFVCGADVATAKTDSSVMITLEQLRQLNTEAPTDDELNRIKSYKIGSYLMSFENSSFVASLIQNADFMGKSIELVKSYPKRLSSISSTDVRNAARKYLNPDNSYIVIAGDPSVKKELEKYGNIFEYDLDLNALTGPNAKIEKVSISADDLLDKYAKAIGGKSQINSIKTLIAEGEGNFAFQGQKSQVNYTRINKIGNKLYQNIDISGYPQKLWTNGTDAYTDVSGTVVKQTGNDISKFLLEAEILQETKLVQIGFKCEVIGKKDNVILMKAISPSNEESTLYFDATTFYLLKKETVIKTGSGSEIGVESYSDYSKIGNFTLPRTLVISGPGYSINLNVSYKIDEEVNDNIFEPEIKDNH